MWIFVEIKALQMMSTNLAYLLLFVQQCMNRLEQKVGRGRPIVYSHSSMVLFFMVMMLKKKYGFKTMEKYAQEHYAVFGFPSAPDRKTIRRRFLDLPRVLHQLMPQIAKECAQLDHKTFGFNWAFIDKSVFCALGGIWHKKHMIAGIVPHSSIDTDASWAKSAYHGWRFGYGLHVICNRNRFPISACVTTASIKDYLQVEHLLTYLKNFIGLLIGDSGYQCAKIIEHLYQNSGILLQTPQKFADNTPISKWYNDLISCAQAYWTYRQRKPSIEPSFALIKELFDLKGETKLPYKGLSKVQSFLTITPFTVQILMYDNFINKRNLGSLSAALCYF